MSRVTIRRRRFEDGDEFDLLDWSKGWSRIVTDAHGQPLCWSVESDRDSPGGFFVTYLEVSDE